MAALHGLLKMVSLGQKVKIPETLKLFCAKKSSENNTKYSRDKMTFKIGHLAKAIAFEKRLVWLKN